MTHWVMGFGLSRPTSWSDRVAADCENWPDVGDIGTVMTETELIVAVLAAGARAGVTHTASSAIGDAYAELTDLLARWLSGYGRARLAHWTGAAGDPAAARDQLAALLPRWEQVYGPEHPSTLLVQDNLAGWTRQAERHQKR